MTITADVWNDYISRLGQLNDLAGNQMLDYINANQIETEDDINGWVRFAYSLSIKYGEAAAALAAEMYDAVSDAEGLFLDPAEPAEPATYDEVAKAVIGTHNNVFNQAVVAMTVGRLVKMAGADTVLKNAIRDRAYVCWIPSGDTCPFCLSIAARGWKRAYADAMKSGHAEHIHANCNCQYAVKHTKETEYESYDENRYKEIFDEADGTTRKMKINSLRREHYAANREEILKQKAANYELRKASEEGA